MGHETQCRFWLRNKEFFPLLYIYIFICTQQKYKHNTFVFTPILSWDEVINLRFLLCTQKVNFSQILFTNLFKSVWAVLLCKGFCKHSMTLQCCNCEVNRLLQHYIYSGTISYISKVLLVLYIMMLLQHC